MNLARTILLIAIVVVPECIFAQNPDRTRRVRKMYENVPPTVLDIAEPVRVLRARAIEDGGSVFVEFKDAKDREFQYLLDRKIGSKTRETMFLFMQDEPKMPVALRGPEEAALYGLLLRWKAPPILDDYSVTSVQIMLNHLDSRFTALPGKTP